MPLDQSSYRPIPEGHRRLEDFGFQIPQKEFAPARPAIPEGHRRLLVLAEFLETKVPREKFDMAYWSSTARLDDCGTVGCACGWATTLPEFAALGLRLGPSIDPPRMPAFPNEATILFDGRRGFYAIGAFFDLSWGEARLLFDHNSMPDRFRHDIPQVAARIRAFVAENAQAAVQAGEGSQT